MFGGNFAPVGWMFCEGQLLPISGNEVLFQLIGTTYGGDGQSTFALPDLRGRLPVHQGGTFVQGGNGGVEQVTLTTNQIPAHNHSAQASQEVGTQSTPEGNVLAQLPAGTTKLYHSPAGSVALSATALAPAGGSQPHSNFQPYLCISFIISMFGIFPSQT
jgi:microcystin-dependent protein